MAPLTGDLENRLAMCSWLSTLDFSGLDSVSPVLACLNDMTSRILSMEKDLCFSDMCYGVTHRLSMLNIYIVTVLGTIVF